MVDSISMESRKGEEKVRVMCSYNGHIVPRPHDGKSLCYIGGDTKIILITNNTCLSSLHNRLSKTLFTSQPFLLKYLLPNHDLDSLISLSTDEDLQNMLEQHHRIINTNGTNKKPGRLRLFLFPCNNKSDDWFLDALNNGKSDDVGLSETSSVNCLLGLDDTKNVSDSPTNSSFGSTSTTPSLKVRMDDGNAKLEIEEHFQKQMSVVKNNVDLKKQEEESLLLVSNVEDEYRLVKQTGGYDLHSPESVSSEGSARNPLSKQGQNVYQEQFIQMQLGNVLITGNPVDLKSGDQNIRNKVQMQRPQVQESGYVLQNGHYDQSHPQLHHQQQQFIHPSTQYIPAGAVPITQYYQMYPPSQQSMHEQQYPVYFMPPRQPQAYNLPMQQLANYGELSASAHSSQPQTPPSATVTPTSGYTQGRVVPSSNPEMPTGVYRTTAPQYVGLPQFHHPSQPMAQSTAGNTPYANYEFADPMQGQIYYTHAMPPPQMAAQYQTMTSGPMNFAQLPAENMKQQVRGAQP